MFSSRFKGDYELITSYKSLHENSPANKRRPSDFKTLLLAMVGLTVIGGLLAIAVLEELKNEENIRNALKSNQTKTQQLVRTDAPYDCSEENGVILVESIPYWMNYEDNATFGVPLYVAWKDLLARATKQVDIASFYWSLTGEDIGVESSTDQPGRDILMQLKSLPKRNVSVRVVSSIPSVAANSTDLHDLKENGVQVRRVNFGHLTRGILHSKFWIVDEKHIFLGSANMDWRALTQVKELGVVIYNCTALAMDLQKIYESYWVMGQSNATIPDPWPSSFDTTLNKNQPLQTNLSGVPSQVYISSSPPIFCPDSRTKDLDAILSIIDQAEQFIHVAVMEYFPASKFFHHHRYWPVIENALILSTFERNVTVRLLISCSRDSDPSVLPFLKSLDALNSPSHNIKVEVRVHVVPLSNQTGIPYARINHNKYMVTDKVAYIGTSNWSADYFNTTAGVGLVISQNLSHSSSPRETLVGQLSAVFQRDWSSKFAVPLNNLDQHPDCSFSKREMK